VQHALGLKGLINLRSRFTALGIPPDASDDLIIFAYRKQTKTDPANTHQYLTYLIQIADDRSSESLQTEVAIERSAGKFDSHQLTNAYRYFGYYIDSPPSDDAYIIRTFQSRVQDAPMQESRMREQLKIIGIHRKSTTILDIAEDCEDTHTHIPR
jgi:ubiquitin carboxyl-terminal hydrolase 25/28